MAIPLSAAKPSKAGCLKVTEQYLCEEGEGSTLGALTWLVRLSGCNLRCWWCDSKQSSFYDDEERQVPASRIAKAALQSRAAWVSFTGGEPTWRSPAELKTLAALCRKLRSRGMKVKIESNGLLLPPELNACVDLWSLAPKWDARKAGPAQRSAAMDYDEGVLGEFQRRYAPDRLQLKFVMESDGQGRPLASEWPRVKGILSRLRRGKKPPVFFIPQAYARGEYLSRLKVLSQGVEKLSHSLKGWDLRVQPQMHRILYGDDRGR